MTGSGFKTMRRNIQAKSKEGKERIRGEKKEETNFVVIFHWYVFCEEMPGVVFLKELDNKTDFDILKRNKKEMSKHNF